VLALVAAKVARVVVAIDDPNQDHPTRWLSPAGIAYEVGCLEATARHLHGGFLSRINRGRPRITGKWAMTLDGCIAAHTGDSGWISSPEALALSRRRRRAFDAILVGSGTAAHDDPKLLSSIPGRTPLRVVVAQHADLALDSHLVTTARHAPVLVIHGPDSVAEKIAALNQAGVLTHVVADAHDPAQVAQALGQRGINDLLIEGGAHIHGAWLRAGLYDRIECYLAPITLGGGQSVCTGTGAGTIRLGTEWLAEQQPLMLGNTLCWRLIARRGEP
jgi:diaminohydroxyphosphoribosylaminopyrimidine deaminase/5-amino-6-(5-phosphoribosylamino)uracil reductase